MKIKTEESLYSEQGEKLIEPSGIAATFSFVAGSVLNSVTDSDDSASKTFKGETLAKIGIAKFSDEDVDLTVKELGLIIELVEEFLGPIYVVQMKAICNGEENPFKTIHDIKNKS